jgi:soluble cytochrome b562
MSEDNIENLPSIEDYKDNSDELPSVEEFIAEEKDLPSVEDFIQKEEEEIKEEVKTDNWKDDYTPTEYESVDVIPAPQWGELVRMVNDVRESIPDIPEIKSYDNELKELSEHLEQLKESIPEVPEVKYYDTEVEAICEQIDSVREEVKNLPEVKYYDDQLNTIEEKIKNLPEPKYYDGEIEAICEAIDSVKEQIPTFPKWVNEVNEVPDFSWIGKTFSVIDDDFVKVGDHIKDLKTKFDSDLNELTENLDLKDFEQRVEIEELNKAKDKIYEELKEAAIKIWSHHDEFKDDDRKLKKSILSKLNETKQNIEKQISELDNKSYESDKNLKGYFEGLKEEIANLPEPKYYDDNISELKKSLYKLDKRYTDTSTNIAELYKIVEDLKKQQTLTEGLLNEPPTYAQSVGGKPDPLTPLDKKFATIEDLSKNYTLFVNRVTQQLATFGGGGAVRFDTLDDVGISTYPIGSASGIATGNLLIYNEHLKLVGIRSDEIGGSAGAGSTIWRSTSVGIHTVSSVGIGTTARAHFPLYVGKVGLQTVAYFDGDISVGGTIFYEDVQHVDSIGISTFRTDVQIGNNLSVVGLTTLGSGNGIGTVQIGTGNTALYVDGDARVVGILTIGRSSVTIDGTTNKVTIGDEDVVISNSSVTIGDNVTIEAGASGINSAPNVFYVAKDGNDSKNGTSIDNAKLTIASAVGVAHSGSTIKVLSGNYQEANPIEVPANVSIVGDDQRSVNVSGSSAHKDIFSVRKGVKLANMTFTGHVGSAAAVGFPTSEIAENVGGGKWKGPYIQNCTSNTTTGVGIRIDGNQARLLKTMNVDAFTQYNQGGVGVAVTNQGYAQLVSVFTICCDKAISCHEGGQADIANSNCSFGTFGLVSDGKSPLQYTGFVTSSAAAGQDNVTLNIGITTSTISGVAYTHTTGEATVTTSGAHPFSVGMGVSLADIGFSCAYGAKNYPEKQPFVFRVVSIPSTNSFTVNLGISTLAHTYVGAGSSAGTAKLDVDRPYDGQICYFDELYESVETITVTNGGSGYTSTPTVTLDAPSGPSGETATAFATLEGESIASITIISSGSQYTETPDVTISGGGGSSGAATAVMAPIYYTINSSTPVTSGITTLTLAENLINTVGVGSTVFFHQQSKIVASSHTFEYIGAGNEIASATPKRGGVTIQANEVLTSNGGSVVYTSTDQSGNFRIGDDFQIDQTTGTISGRSFSKSLFSEMTPFILALS